MSDSPNSPKSQSQSESQSLFQIYYVGQTSVDKRCSSAVMPWIIEELKLKATEMKFIWLTPGPDGVSYVADNGLELFNHSYGGIVQCCIAVDGISFAYIFRREKDNRYLCHVFQALTYEEAAQIMAKFRKHAREEVYVGNTLNRQSNTSPDLVQHHLIFPHQQQSSKANKNGTKNETCDETLCEYHLQYLGKFEVSSPATSDLSQVQTIDNIVAKLKETAKKTRAIKNKSKRKSFGAMFRRSASSQVSVSTDDVESSPAQLAGADEEGLYTVDSSTSVGSVGSAGSADSSSEVAIKVTCASPTEKDTNEEVKGQDDDSREGTPASAEGLQAKSASVDSGLQSVVQTSIPNAPQEEGNGDKRTSNKSEGSDFDTLPELASLQDSPEFQGLSQKSLSSKKQLHQKVKLVFSGLSVKVVVEETGEELLKRKIRTIVCCAQGKKEGEYLGFTTKEGPKDSKAYFMHLFLSESYKMAAGVLETFKSAFVHALSLTMPAALCDSCPLQELHNLCKRLENVSTQVAQTQIQESLATFNEADYARIMHQYKSSEHADHEYTQIVTLVSLLRQHFEKKQEHHTHHLGDERMSMSDVGGDKLRVPALTRAKMAITSSIDNLRSRQPVKKSQTVDSQGKTVVDERTTQSLNVNHPTSPLFSRKTNLDTLMAPVALSPSKNESSGGLKRERSWSGGGFRLRRARNPSPASEKSGSNLDKSKEEETKKNKDVPAEKENNIVSPLNQVNGSGSNTQEERTITPPPIQSPTRLAQKIPLKTPGSTKVRSLRSRDRMSQRHSLTPPSTFSSEYTSKFQRKHRRSLTAHATIMSWRQEIFDSVYSPTKLEGRDRKSSNELLEEFEIIEPPPIDQVGMGYMSPKSRFTEQQQSPRSRARKRWKSAIEQQMMLNRMERQNRVVLEASSDADMKKLKLCYSDPLLKPDIAMATWSNLLEQSDPMQEEVQEALLTGVPITKRGEVWSFLIDRYKAREGVESDLPPEFAGKAGFELLCQGTTEYEHNIVVDLGRTFPSHPYFSNSLNHSGQDSLRKILHAYAVADRETGYCQGISFIAGMILMHTKDEEIAFKTFYQMMVLYHYRKIYFANLSNLQIRLYQFSRLLHDFCPPVYQVLRENEVTPFFYAAPWFLTIFASQYPIAFTARVFDLYFLEGADIVFKVALTLMKFHEENLLECTSMESTCNYLKTALPESVLTNMSTIFKEALQIDLGNKLQSFETEYEIMVELTNTLNRDDVMLTDMESVNTMLKKQNMTLIEQLAICHGSIRNLEGVVSILQDQLERQQEKIDRLERLMTSRNDSPVSPNILSSNNEPEREHSQTDSEQPS